MIRVYKHGVAPASLANAQKYNDEDVIRQLQADQHKKCYLCERILATDFQVEHLNSQANRPELVYDWNNLFLHVAIVMVRNQIVLIQNIIHPKIM